MGWDYFDGKTVSELEAEQLKAADSAMKSVAFSAAAGAVALTWLI